MVTSNISINDVILEEGNPRGPARFRFTVSLDQASTDPVSVKYTTNEDTARGGGFDYFNKEGSLIFNPGELTKDIIVKVISDTVWEDDENFFLNSSDPLNANISDFQGIGTILNDDNIPNFPNISIDDVTLTEGSPKGLTKFIFTATLDQPSILPVMNATNLS